MSAGILNEVDNIVGALKPRFYNSESATAPHVQKLASSAPKAARAALIEAYTASMHADIAAVVSPVQIASTDFLQEYDSRLDTLLGLNDVSEGGETLLDKVEVGVSSWASSLVTMAAVFAGVFFEARRNRRKLAPRH